MSDLPENELFSAYLDGELSAAERAQMEQILASDPAARQLLEELRALSGTIQSLPRQKLDEDLTLHVLRLAERRMLTEEPSDLPDVDAAPVPLARSIFRRFTTPRIIIWTAVTAIMAVAILVNEKRNSNRIRAPHEIARTVSTLKEPLPPSSMTAAPAAREVGRETKTVGVGEGKVESVKGSERGEAGAEEGVAKQGRALLAKEKGVSAGETSVGSWGGKPEVSSPSAPAPMTAATTTSPMSRPALAASAQPAASATAAEKRAAGKPKPVSDEFRVSGRRGRVVARGGEGGRNQNEESGEKDEYGMALPRQPNTGEEVLVVECAVSPEAVEQKTFDKLLTSNRIVWQEVKVDESRDVAGSQAATPAHTSPKSGKSGSGEKTIEKDGFLATEDRQNRAETKSPLLPQKAIAGQESQPSDADAAEKLDVVYVEASADQVKATLSGMAAQPEAFSELSIRPASEETLVPTGGPLANGPLIIDRRESRSDRKPGEMSGKSDSEAAPSPDYVPRRNVQQGKQESQNSANLNFRLTLPAPPQNQTQSAAFAQRVQLNVLPDSEDHKAVSGPSARSGPAAAELLMDQQQKTQWTLNVQQLRNAPRAQNAQVQLQQLPLSARNQRVLFVLHPAENATNVAAPAANPVDSSSAPAKPAERASDKGSAPGGAP